MNTHSATRRQSAFSNPSQPSSDDVLSLASTPRVLSHQGSSVLIIAMLFTGFSILSNLTAMKLAVIAGYSFPAGLIFFPMTYVFDDILTEVYGFEISRRIIWSAMLANCIVMLGTMITVFLPASPLWHDQVAYSSVFLTTPRVFCASITAYLFGEFSNSIILSRLKVKTAGKKWWLRFFASTLIGVSVDTTIFCHLALWGRVPYNELLNILFMLLTVKVVYEVLAMPLSYRISQYLKRKDNVDQYDYHVSYNPFSMGIKETRIN